MAVHRYGEVYVTAENVRFVVLAAPLMNSKQCAIMEITPEQKKADNAFGHLTEYDDAKDEITFMVFVGKQVAKDMRMMCKYYDLTYDRVCRAFLCNLLVLDTLNDHTEMLVTSTVNAVNALLVQRERTIMRGMVSKFVKGNGVDGRAFPRPIQALLNE